MDENMSQAIGMFGAAILFVVAFSCAIVAYNGLTERTEQFFEINTIAGKREDATTMYMDSAEVERKVSFEEVYLAILDLPRYVSLDGNSDLTEIQVGSATYTATFDPVTNIKTIKLTGAGALSDDYVVGDKGQMLSLLKTFCTIVGGFSPSGSSSNEILRNYKDTINTITFSIQYDEDAIMYTRN